MITEILAKRERMDGSIDRELRDIANLLETKPKTRHEISYRLRNRLADESGQVYVEGGGLERSVNLVKGVSLVGLFASGLANGSNLFDTGTITPIFAGAFGTACISKTSQYYARTNYAKKYNYGDLSRTRPIRSATAFAGVGILVGALAYGTGYTVGKMVSMQ